jgi:3-isopropylmalate/(R)-2-methylmalate dehydratase small subunit
MPGYQLHVSLESQTVKDDLGFEESFTIDPFRRSCLLEGLDDIGLAMRHTSALNAYEQKHDAAFWSAPRPVQGVSV